MRKIFEISTDQREILVDITPKVEKIVRSSGIENGLVALYAQGATGAIMIQENWDDSVQTDVVNLLAKMIPHGVWLHDQQDGKGDAHQASQRPFSIDSGRSPLRAYACKPDFLVRPCFVLENSYCRGLSKTLKINMESFSF